MVKTVEAPCRRHLPKLTERKVYIMKTTSNHHPIGAATDRIHRMAGIRRALTLVLAGALTIVWVSVPTAALAAEDAVRTAYPAESTDSASADTSHQPDSEVTEAIEEDNSPSRETSLEECLEESLESPETADEYETGSHGKPLAEWDALPLTPEAEILLSSMARGVELPLLDPPIELPARTTYRPLYPYPSGAMAVTLYKDGRQVLQGHAADIGGTVYVPVQRFADLFGTFRTIYVEATEEVVITGANLSIAVKVGDPYITVNDRIFYTGSRVISLGLTERTNLCADKTEQLLVTALKNYNWILITF